MDVLNEHLAQLKLMNSRPLSPKSVDLASTSSSSSSTGNSGGSSINNSGAVTSGTVLNSGGGIHKNTGPAVPPKPMKKNPTQIPYNNNNIIRQTCEPIYSTKNLHKNDMLQSNAAVISKVPILPSSSSITSTLPTASISHAAKLQQNQNLSRSSNKQSHYSNMEMTLDNPAILNHQLEALEHHKKQLEMKGMLPSSASSTLSSSSGNKYSTNNVKLAMEKFQEINDVTNTIDSPSKIHVYSNTSILKSKLPSSLSLPSSSPSSAATPTSSSASSSASSSGLNLKKNSDIVYSNILHQQNNASSSGVIHHPPPPPPSSSSVSSYVPVSVSPAPPHQVYSNINYNSGVGELPPPPPLELPGSNINLNNPHSFALDYTHQINEDDLPPPPSPVSSSYSELRRATDNFPQMPVYPLPSVYDNGGSSISSGIDPLSGATDQQTYVNTSFQNDYSTYGPISQASSSPNSDCYGYGSLSKDSSTYESIYEPINPRPPSQLSSRSNYSLYTSYVNGIQSGSPGTPLGTTGKSIGGSNVVNGSSNSVGGRLSTNKEAEVENLTDLLVHSMDAGCDVDSFGVCVKCGERVVGENSGCTAMEQIYHIACFTCAVCQINLQGKPFYALDGKPHCEEDYLNTLEKCSVCMKPILERILRATGKPYHPGCFTCIVCGNSLDGIPFTVDATNQNYCIEDFHKKFAPRCCVCKQPIMPEPGQEETVRVVALDRSFHFECYKCEDCGLLLSSEAEGRGCYPLDDHVLCKSCNAKRVQALTNCMTTEL